MSVHESIYVGNTKENISIKNKLSHQRKHICSIKLFISCCCCVIILPLFVGWYIIRCESEPLHSYKQLSNSSLLMFYTIHCSIFHSNPPSVWLGLCSWSHHISNLLDPSIRSAPVQSSYIGLPATYSAIVACCLLTYSIIGQIPVVSNAAPTEDHSH